jgi:hypothetical protein
MRTPPPASSPTLLLVSSLPSERLASSLSAVDWDSLDPSEDRLLVMDCRESPWEF